VLDLAEPRTHVGYVRQRARVHQSVVGQRVRSLDPHMVGDLHARPDHRCLGDLAHFDQQAKGARRELLRRRTRRARLVVELDAVFVDLERRNHREDHFAVLDRGDVAR
jgi:hypothetical protein